MSNWLSRAGEKWLEGWRVFGRYILFQVELWISFLPLSILFPLVMRYVVEPARTHDQAQDDVITLPIVIVLLFLTAFVYIPFAFFLTSQASGLMRRRMRPAWKEEIPENPVPGS